MTGFSALKAKAHSYFTMITVKIKKEREIQMCVIKRKLKFEDCKHCLKETQLENKINQLKNLKLI